MKTVMNPKDRRINVATAIFVFSILIAGASNAAAKKIVNHYVNNTGDSLFLPAVSTLLFCVNLSLYLFLIVFWLQSVYSRLLPSRERSYIVSATLCAVMLLLLRTVRYRLLDGWNYELMRAFWYLYYVPMILMPTLLLMTCIRIENKNSRRRFNELILLVPAIILISLFLTNDLHYLAFRPTGYSEMSGANASYINNVLFYVYYGYFGTVIVIGMILLVRANRKLHGFRRVFAPFAFLLIMLMLVLVDKTLNWVRLPSMFTAPEIVAFGMIGIFESCVRNRLIPYNENYSGFFAQMRFPAVIAHSDMTIAYRSAVAVEASSEQLHAAVGEPVYLDEDTKLTGKPITAGFAFYTEDESELRRLNERLADANELIASENDLILAENELKARQAAVDSRNIIYTQIAEKMLPYHSKAMRMLDDMDPDKPDFAEKVARLNLLNTYIKRGTNLLLTNEGEAQIPLCELKLAFDEFARYLHYCGVQSMVSITENGSADRDVAFVLWTAFYEIAESILDAASMLQVVLTDSRLRLTADCCRPSVLPEHVAAEENDGMTYFTVEFKGGAA